MFPCTATAQLAAIGLGLRITRIAGGWTVAWPGNTTRFWTGTRDGDFGPADTALIHTDPAGLAARWRECSGQKLPLPDRTDEVNEVAGPELYGCDPTRFRQLTVWQPWAEFIVPDLLSLTALHGMSTPDLLRIPKPVENRSTTVVGRWRGTLLIHAGVEPDTAAMARFGLDPARFVYGAVLGTVELVDVVTDSPSWWAEPGSHHLLLRDPRRLRQPVGERGCQGAQQPKAPLLSMVLRQLPRKASVPS